MQHLLYLLSSPWSPFFGFLKAGLQPRLVPNSLFNWCWPWTPNVLPLSSKAMIQAWANTLSLNFILKTLIFTVLCMSNVYYETAESQKGFQSYNGLCLHIDALSVNSSREWLQGPEAALYGDSTGVPCPGGNRVLQGQVATGQKLCTKQPVLSGPAPLGKWNQMT